MNVRAEAGRVQRGEALGEKARHDPGEDVAGARLGEGHRASRIREERAARCDKRSRSLKNDYGAENAGGLKRGARSIGPHGRRLDAEDARELALVRRQDGSRRKADGTARAHEPREDVNPISVEHERKVKLGDARDDATREWSDVGDAVCEAPEARANDDGGMSRKSASDHAPGAGTRDAPSGAEGQKDKVGGQGRH